MSEMNSQNSKWQLGEAIEQDWSVGQILKAAREYHSFSIDYVCNQLRFRESLVRALENDDYDMLPQVAYVRGYIRSYAKLLDIDWNVLQKKMDSVVRIEPSPVVTRKKKKRLSPDRILNWSTGAIIALFAGLLAVWWLYPQQDPVSQFSDYTDAESVLAAKAYEETDDSSQSAKGVQYSDIPDLPLVSQSKAQQSARTEMPRSDQKEISGSIDHEAVGSTTGQIQTTAQGSADTRAEELNSTENQLINGEQDHLIVRYLEESWTVITDAKDRKLLHGLYKSGAVRTLKGEAPFTIFLGNSPGVDISINGKKFDQSRFNRSNRTARFELADSNS